MDIFVILIKVDSFTSVYVRQNLSSVYSKHVLFTVCPFYLSKAIKKQKQSFHHILNSSLKNFNL